MLKFTTLAKLQAFELKYYQHQKWEPKVGDYYTMTRSDLELFKIVAEENGVFKILGVYGVAGTMEIEREDFINGPMSDRRMHVCERILKVYCNG